MLQIDPGTFRDSFDRTPFLIRHDLAQHPLFSLDRLVALSRRLPADGMENIAGDVPVTVDPARMPTMPLSVDETIRRIQECKAWMVLRNVERDPEYRRLLDRCLDEVRELSEPVAHGMRCREGWIFISSPGSVTPYHMDPEHNFLLQVRGSKAIHVFDGRDRGVLSEQELERFFTGGHRNLVLPEDDRARALKFELHAGDGLHFPVTFPHYVRNGDAVSVSFSITFQTPSSERRAAVHKVNAHLRRRGFVPAPAGSSAWRDAVKYRAFEGARRLARLVRPLQHTPSRTSGGAAPATDGEAAPEA